MLYCTYYLFSRHEPPFVGAPPSSSLKCSTGISLCMHGCFVLSSRSWAHGRFLHRQRIKEKDPRVHCLPLMLCQVHTLNTYSTERPRRAHTVNPRVLIGRRNGLGAGLTVMRSPPTAVKCSRGSGLTSSLMSSHPIILPTCLPPLLPFLINIVGQCHLLSFPTSQI